MDVAEGMRRTQGDAQGHVGQDRFIYTAHAFILSLFFDCPSGMGLKCPDSEQVARVEAAVRRGDITWTAFPFK